MIWLVKLSVLGVYATRRNGFVFDPVYQGRIIAVSRVKGRRSLRWRRQGGVFIQSSGIQAFCSPVMSLIDLLDDDVKYYHSGDLKTLEEWRTHFEESRRRMEEEHNRVQKTEVQ